MRISALCFGLLIVATPARGQAPAVLEGRVLDARCEPIAGAGVLIGVPEALLTADALERPLARTDASGRFALTMPPLTNELPRSRLVYIAARGKTPLQRPAGTPWSWMLGVESRVDLGDCVLEDAVTLKGRVRTSDGRPLQGARVTARDLLAGYAAPGWHELNAGIVQGHALTAADGSFELPAVPGSPLEVAVDHAGYYRQSLAPVSDADPLVLELSPSGITRGRLLDAAGAPQRGMLQVTYEASPETETLLTGADGGFELTVRFRGRYRLACVDHRNPRPTWFASPRVLARSEVLDGPRADVKLRLAAARGWLHVRALGPDGKRITRFSATVSWQDHEFAPLSSLLGTDGGVDADADGTARLPAPEAGATGTGTVRLRAEGFATALRTGLGFERDGQEVELGLVPEAVITGSVIDPDTGKGIAGADVRVVRPFHGEEIIGRLVEKFSPAVIDDTFATGADGTFRIGGLGHGKHQVLARVAGRPAGRAVHVSLQQGQQRAGLRLLLPGGGRVEGTLTGAALPRGLRIGPRDETGALHGMGMSLAAMVLTGSMGTLPMNAGDALVEKGAFALDGLAGGLLGLEVRVPSPPRLGPPLAIPIERVRVRAGETVREELDVTRALPARWFGRVLADGDHLPMHRLRLVAGSHTDPLLPLARGGLERRAGVAADGSFSVLLPPGTHRLRIEDVVTGVSFALVESVKLASGQQREQDVKISVVGARVRLEPERGRALVAGRLVVHTDDEKGGDFALFLGDLDHGRAISLSCAPAEVELFVPPGRTSLKVLIDSGRLAREGRGTVAPAELGALEFDARAGAPKVLVIQVARPPDVPD